MGYSQAVRHQTLTLAFVGSNPAAPANFKTEYDPLAQLAEHLPFKEGVRGSNPRWITKIKAHHRMCFYFAYLWMFEPRTPIYWIRCPVPRTRTAPHPCLPCVKGGESEGPGGIVDFLISPSQLHMSALAGARFSVTFDCPKVTKGHRGCFKPPPGPPGEGVSGFWYSLTEARMPRPCVPFRRCVFRSLIEARFRRTSA